MSASRTAAVAAAKPDVSLPLTAQPLMVVVFPEALFSCASSSEILPLLLAFPKCFDNVQNLVSRKLANQYRKFKACF